MKLRILAAATAVAFSVSQPALADHDGPLTRADSHAPIGVMAEHIHNKGEWMFSYRFMAMPMQGNLSGSSGISPDEIVTTVPNRFFGNPGQPPTLRIVPLEMDMNMHMLGLMYAPSNNITLMAMLNYLEKDMDHVTYQGGAGTTELGNFTTETSGLADASLSALISFLHRDDMKVHAILGVSIPTGSVDETDDILTPMGMRPTVRVPYPMQLGSGSWDPIVGLNYSGFGEKFAWGAQWKSTFRLSDNDENYQLGDEHRLTGWLSYSPITNLSTSIRAEYLDRADISGIDPVIAGPVQTADPNRQGGERLDIGVGVNYAATGAMHGWRFALEYMMPVEQDLNGPQLETDSVLTFGVQRSWQ